MRAVDMVIKVEARGLGNLCRYSGGGDSSGNGDRDSSGSGDGGEGLGKCGKSLGKSLGEYVVYL